MICPGILAGFFVGILPGVIYAWLNGLTFSDAQRYVIWDIRRALRHETDDEYIPLADIQAHRYTARHGTEPYRSQSIEWLDRHGK